MAKTNPINRALELRQTLIKGPEILAVDFSDTLQGQDTSMVIDLMPNIITGDKVFRAKVNFKGIDPISSSVYGYDFKDIRKLSDKQIEDLLKRQEFDFPLWFKHDEGFSMQRVHDFNPPFITQLAGCNFHDGSSKGGCFYCFVDDKSNDGKPGPGKVWLHPIDAVESMIVAREKVSKFYEKVPEQVKQQWFLEQDYKMNIALRVFRFSGGEPTLALDWALSAWRYIEHRSLNFVGQIDSNLSTGRVVEKFEAEGIYESHILEKLAQYPIKILTAIKGTDEANLQRNVQSYTTMQAQEYSIKMFLKAGFEIFPQIYNPNPQTLEAFLKHMDSQIENFSLRVHIGPLKGYGPTKKRLRTIAITQGQNIDLVLATQNKEWADNYRIASEEIMEKYLQRRYGVGYKDTVRSDVRLKLLKP